MRRSAQTERRREEVVIDAAHRREHVVVVVEDVVGVEERAERVAGAEERLEGGAWVSMELVLVGCVVGAGVAVGSV